MTVNSFSIKALKFLSTDTKPTTNLPPFAFGVETDTGVLFWWNGTAWATMGNKPSDISKVTGDTPYTAIATDRTIRIDNSAGSTDFVLNLPTAVGITGRTYTIIRTDILLSANKTLVTPNGSETIDGVATNYRLWPAEKLTIVSDGANWISIERPTPSQTGYYWRKGTTAARWFPAGLVPSNSSFQISTTSPTVNVLYAMPFVVARVTKFERMLFNVTTQETGKNARMGIYHDDGNCYPGTLIFDSGSISLTGTGQKTSTITAGLQTFQPGLYWLAWESDNAGVVQVKTLASAPANYAVVSSSGNSSTEIGGFAYSVAHTYGALPNPYTAAATILTVSTVGAPVPAVCMQAI